MLINKTQQYNIQLSVTALHGYTKKLVNRIITNEVKKERINNTQQYNI